jgi:AraC family transcriptional regulator, transcriptional activator of pobA
MSVTESLEEFYRQKFDKAPDNLKQDIGHFNVFDMSETYSTGRVSIRYVRRDFYKVMLIRGHHLFHYADKSIEIKGSNLIFFNPKVPYKFERLTAQPSGHICIFKEAFFPRESISALKDLPVFNGATRPVYTLNEEQDAEITGIFKQIQKEIQTDFLYKYDLIRNYLLEIMFLALKIEPQETLSHLTDASARLTTAFCDLLERQFPIESTEQQMKLRLPKAFAHELHVHVNHLNRAVRFTTGKTTTQLISERMIAEAKVLLQHTNWNIAEISYCLGFEEPSNFNHFFKKRTKTTPGFYR